ncbi:MAG: DUF2071 domain-containing protein [Ferruginibacter sp.]
MQRVFLTATWENLVMVNYIVDAALLLPYVPAKTTIDTYNGNVYISLVGFNFLNTKLAGIKIPFHSDFEEVNLRFYVQQETDNIVKRGVVFIKEIVPKPAISFVANVFYREKYSAMPMKHSIETNDDDLKFGYYWKNKNKWNSLEAVTHKEAVAINPGSEAEFIAEHYWGYSKHRERTYEYEVQHPKWNIYPVKAYTIKCDFEKLYGKHFSFLENAEPASVFVAKGSGIKVLSKTLL